MNKRKKKHESNTPTKIKKPNNNKLSIFHLCDERYWIMLKVLPNDIVAIIIGYLITLVFDKDSFQILPYVRYNENIFDTLYKHNVFVHHDNYFNYIIRIYGISAYKWYIEHFEHHEVHNTSIRHNLRLLNLNDIFAYPMAHGDNSELMKWTHDRINDYGIESPIYGTDLWNVATKYNAQKCMNFMNNQQPSRKYITKELYDYQLGHRNVIGSCPCIQSVNHDNLDSLKYCSNICKNGTHVKYKNGSIILNHDSLFNMAVHNHRHKCLKWLINNNYASKSIISKKTKLIALARCTDCLSNVLKNTSVDDSIITYLFTFLVRNKFFQNTVFIMETKYISQYLNTALRFSDEMGSLDYFLKCFKSFYSWGNLKLYKKFTYLCCGVFKKTGLGLLQFITACFYTSSDGVIVLKCQEEINKFQINFIKEIVKSLDK